MIDRKYSDGTIWPVSIDCDDDPDGNDGGYDSRANYVIPEAMREIVLSRKRIAELELQTQADIQTMLDKDERIAELEQQVACLEGELDVANKECEENLRRAPELESKISFWFAIGIVAASFAIITLGYYIDTA